MMTPAKHLGLSSPEAWRVFRTPRTDLYRREDFVVAYQEDARSLRRLPIGRRFTASELRHRWGVAGVSNVLSRGLWAGVLTYDARDAVTGERIYRRVK